MAIVREVDLGEEKVIDRHMVTRNNDSLIHYTVMPFIMSIILTSSHNNHDDDDAVRDYVGIQ